MQCSESLANLAGALVKAQGQLDKAEKNSQNPHLKNKYANLGAVMDAAIEALNSNGLAVVQAPAPSGEDTLALETTLIHTSGEWISGTIIMPLPKRDPQGYGSAMTYARRYGLAAMVGVVQDDDDGHAASHQQSTNNTARPAPQQTPRHEEEYATPPAERVPQNGVAGQSGEYEATKNGLWKMMKDKGWVEPDGEGSFKPVKEFWHHVKRLEFPSKYSTWTPEQYAQMIGVLSAMSNAFEDQ